MGGLTAQTMSPPIATMTAKVTVNVYRVYG